MEDIDVLLQEFSELDSTQLKSYGERRLQGIVQILASEIIRLRQAEQFNQPILRSAMMHMPIG